MPKCSTELDNTHSSAVDEPVAVMDNELVDLVDLNADGLPDILKTESGGGAHTVAVNRGPIQHLTPGSPSPSDGEGARGRGWAIQWAAPVAVDPGAGTAWNFDLASDRTHLADMDGDGLADLVHKSADNSVFFFANRGKLAWGARQDMTLQGAVPPAPFGNAGVRTADVDFDKRIDVIQSLDLGGGIAYRIWFNVGNQAYSSPVTVESSEGFDFAVPGVQIADGNGDRVPDVARIRPGAVLIAVGLGYGRFAEPRSMVLPDLTLDDLQIAKAKLADINGDGLADLVLERAAPGACWYWLNLGNYTFSSRKTIVGLPAAMSATTAVRWADLNGNGTTDLIYADGQATPRIQMIELGDLVSGGLAPNLLTRIENGIGRVTRIEYAPSTRFALEDAAAGKPWPDALPFPVTVVAGVTVSDSLGHEYRTRFRYHDGYYDSVEKQFRGFAHAEQVDVGDPTAPTLISRSHFDTGRDFDAMKGRLLRSSAETEDGRVFSDESTTWADPPRTLMVGTNGLAVRFAHPVASAKQILELGQGTPRRMESESDYDNFGNQTRLANYGIVVDGDRMAFDDERITITEYALNLSSWIIRLPKRQSVQDEHGAVISRSESFYDDETFSGNNLGSVTIGNLTLGRDWINPSNATAFVQSARTKYDVYGNLIAVFDPLSDGTPNQGHFREMTYDDGFHSYPTRETIHVGNGKPDLVFRAAYDEGLATMVSSTDFNGNTTTYAYDGLARLTSVVKPYDTAAFPTMEYDYALAVRFPLPLGGGEGQGEGVVNYVETRQLDKNVGQASSPAGSGSVLAASPNSGRGRPLNPQTGTSALQEKRDHYLISRQYSDGFGRSLMTRSEAEPAPGGNAPRVVVTGAVQFNLRQKPVRALNLFFTLRSGSLDELLAFENIEASDWSGQFHENGSLVSLDLGAAHKSLTEYDAMLRAVQATNPDSTRGRTEYEPLVTRTFDENDSDAASPHFNTPMVHTSDGLGRLIRADEVVRLNDDGTASGAINTWTTHYEYDLNDRLTRITDSQNNVKVMRYDGLKRKTFTNDPDCGISANVFDDASNLIETVDAKNQRISYTYDGVNRILTEDYHDENSTEFSNQRSPDVAYHYDQPAESVDNGDGTRATARNIKGMLAFVEDISGEEHTSFDARDRVEWTVKRIFDSSLNPKSEIRNPNSLVSYRTAFDYDSLDRVTRLIYPDNDEVTYRFNARSLLERIGGGPSGSIVSAVGYLPSAQQNQIDYGNGVRTTYAYDSRLRLTRLNSLSPPRGYVFSVRSAAVLGRSNVRPPTAQELLGISPAPKPAAPEDGRIPLNRYPRGEGQGEGLIDFTYTFDGASNIREIRDQLAASAVAAADKRRNSQAFTYDDLYRLTRAQYNPSTLNPQPSTNFISYRYDRLGNMLAQTSDIAHIEKGFSVTDVGTMAYGGVAGRLNRVGRQPNDPPGPHALTSITQPSTLNPQPRIYSYDGNGNMTSIDGLACTWDFMDRLVAVEDETTRAEYTYDFASRRITKRVQQKASLAPGGGEGQGEGAIPSTLNPQPSTVVYVGKHFEVREHDQPTKYVFNGSTRVARITGSLSTNTRIQRLRLHPGWNLCSVAVGGARLPSSPEIQTSYQWNATTQAWESVATNASLPAGTILWLHAATNATLALTGAYSDTTNRPITAGGSFQPSAGLEARPLLGERAGVRADVALSIFKASAQLWQLYLPAIPSFDPGFPEFLAPGSAVFVHAEAPAELKVPETALRIRYYHQDHLGSSSVITDADGAIVEETAFYPFGEARNEYRLRQIEESYKFTQKERDRESGLHYFESRYLVGRLSRFATADLKYANPDALSAEDLASFLSSPQEINLYAYVGNNPLSFVDPTGLDKGDNHMFKKEFEAGAKARKESGVTIGVDWDIVGFPLVMVKEGIFALIGVNTANAPGHGTKTHKSLSYWDHAKDVAITVGGGKVIKSASKWVGGKIFGGTGSSVAAAEGKAVSTPSIATADTMLADTLAPGSRASSTAAGSTSASWRVQQSANNALLERNTQYIMDNINAYQNAYGRAPAQNLVNQYIKEADILTGSIEHLLP